MKDLIKKWWFWMVVLIIVVVICFTIILSIFLALNKNKVVDCYNMTSYEVKEYLEEKGYTFEISDYNYIYNTHYIIIRNDKDGILIQQYQNELIGTETSFKNTSCNDEFANVSSESANKTDNKKKQYIAYIDWLNDMRLSKSQVIDVLEYYDKASK